MRKKAVRTLAMLMIVAVLLSTTAAFAATYTKATEYSFVTCGDKLLRKTTLYIKNTSSSAGWITATVTSNTGCGVSRTVCTIPKGKTGRIDIYTSFGHVGEGRVRISPDALSKNYSCSLWTSDGSNVVRVK